MIAGTQLSDQDLETDPYCALRCLGHALRSSAGIYHWSQPVKQLHVFWSHARHGEAWTKIFTLLLIHNGTAALVCGSVAALGMAIVSLFDVSCGSKEVVPILGPLDGNKNLRNPSSLILLPVHERRSSATALSSRRGP